MLHWNDDLAPRNETFSSFRSNSSIRCNKIPSGVTVYGDPRNDPDITCDESNIESHQSLTFPLVMDYYFFRQFAKVSSFPRKRDISPEVKKKKNGRRSGLKRSKAFPEETRGRWKMEVTRQLARRQRGGLIKGAFVLLIASSVGCTAFRVTNRQFTRCVTRIERP